MSRGEIIKSLRILFFAAMSMALITLMGGSCTDKGTTSSGDTTAPTIVSTSPVDSAVSVSVQSDIVITFSEPVDTADLHLTVFMIEPSFAANLSQQDSVVTIDPVSDLLYETTYTVTITTDLSDSAGNNLAEQFQFLFSTESDPNAVPPEIVTIWPGDGYGFQPIDINPYVSFSKGMDSTTLTSATFSIAGVSGTVSYSSANRAATFTPDTDLEYSTTYDVAVSTAVADTFGIYLPSRRDWSFSTRKDPAVPMVSITIPYDSTVIADTVTVFANVYSENLNDSVQFYVNGSLDTTTTYGALDTTTTSSSFFLFDASSTALGSSNSIYAVAYDTLGNAGISDTIVIFNLWQPLAIDIDPVPGIPQEIQRIYYRTTDSILEFRFEFATAWKDPVNDTALDLAIFFDTDQSEITGRQTFGGHDLNDIGAEKRLIVGVHGDTALANWNSGSSHWDLVYDPSGFTSLNLLWDTTFFEVGLRWLDLDNTYYIDLVCINAFFVDIESAIFDWAPDEGEGHFTIKRANRFLGLPSNASYGTKLRTDGIIEKPTNPFN